MLGALIVILLFAACWVPRDPNKCNFWGALIGAGASLIGGALNRKAQKKANAANSPGGQVAQWEAAGVNPLFGISSGGYVPQQAASIGDAFATAGGQFARGLEMDHEKKLRETGMELENEKLRKQIDILSNPQDPSYLASYGGIMPLPRLGGRYAGRNIQTVSGDPVGGSSNVTSPLEPGDATVTHVGYLGDGTYVNPRLRDAEASETRYGDVMQEVSGWYNLAADNWYNDEMQRVVDQYGRPVAEQVHSQYAQGGEQGLSKIIEKVTAGRPTSSRPRPRPVLDQSSGIVVPQWGTQEYSDHMRWLYQ